MATGRYNHSVVVKTAKGWKFKRRTFDIDSGLSATQAMAMARTFAPQVSSMAALILAILPIGAYELASFMADSHMRPSDAVKALQDAQAKRGMAHHFETFQLRFEGLEAPRTELSEALRQKSLSPTSFSIPSLASFCCCPEGPRTRGSVFRVRHDAQFKAGGIAACREPGASVAPVAQAHGLNANLVRKWLVGNGLSAGCDFLSAAGMPVSHCTRSVLRTLPGAARLDISNPVNGVSEEKYALTSQAVPLAYAASTSPLELLCTASPVSWPSPCSRQSFWPPAPRGRVRRE